MEDGRGRLHPHTQPPRSVRAASSLSRSARREPVRLGQSLLDYGSRQARPFDRSKRGLIWGTGKESHTPTSNHPRSVRAASSLSRSARREPVRLGQSLLDYGSRQARTCARSKRSLIWRMGEESFIPTLNHPVRFEQLRACREASVENSPFGATPSRQAQPPLEANGVRKCSEGQRVPPITPRRKPESPATPSTCGPSATSSRSPHWAR